MGGRGGGTQRCVCEEEPLSVCVSERKHSAEGERMQPEGRGEVSSVERVNACCQIERDGEGRGQTQQGLGGGKGSKDFDCLRGKRRRTQRRQFGLSQVESQAGCSVEQAVLHCGCKLYHLRDQRIAAAEQEESVLVDYHVCPLNAPGCCIFIRVRSGQSSAYMAFQNCIISFADARLYCLVE